MEQPMFSLTSYHGERKLAWKRICNNMTLPAPMDAPPMDTSF